MGSRRSSLQRNLDTSPWSKCAFLQPTIPFSLSQQILIANEADVSHQDVFGFSPLHMAAIQGFTTIVEVGRLLSNAFFC